MGNISGVAIAISLGGTGAIFWMWVTALFGMITKFYTCSLAVLYRKKVDDKFSAIETRYGSGYRWNVS